MVCFLPVRALLSLASVSALCFLPVRALLRLASVSQQANVYDNESDSDISDDVDGNNDDDEFITNCFLNPVIDGHIRQVNTNVVHHSKFTEKELQSEYFRNKTAISLEPIETITNNDIVLSDRMNERSPHSEIFKEGRQAWATLIQRNDTMSKILLKRLLLKMVDEMRHSKDWITCRLVKTHKTMVPMNG